MPEGHTLRYAANALAPLVGSALAASARHPRGQAVAAAIDGRTLVAVETRGKHLLARLDDGRTLHSHLRMSGAWHAYAPDRRWRRPASGAWLVLAGRERTVVQFGGPVLEVLDPARLALHPTLSRLGPDVLADDFDPALAARRALAAAPEGAIGEVLLDQRIACGIGNMFRSEVLWGLRVDPFASVSALAPTGLEEVFAEAARQMRHAVDLGHEPPKRVYGRERCERCGGPISRRAHGDDGRVAHWCPECQVMGWREQG
jgi:endonuclease-8